MGLGALWVQPRTLCLLPVPWELSRVPVSVDEGEYLMNERQRGCAAQVLQSRRGWFTINYYRKDPPFCLWRFLPPMPTC